MAVSFGLLGFPNASLSTDRISGLASRAVQPQHHAQLGCEALLMTVTIQRAGLLDSTSMTERTHPLTSDPFTVTVVCWRRCWSYRQRLANFRSIVSNVCMQNQAESSQTVPHQSITNPAE